IHAGICRGRLITALDDSAIRVRVVRRVSRGAQIVPAPKAAEVVRMHGVFAVFVRVVGLDSVPVGEHGRLAAYPIERSLGTEVGEADPEAGPPGVEYRVTRDKQRGEPIVLRLVVDGHEVSAGRDRLVLRIE